MEEDEPSDVDFGRGRHSDDYDWPRERSPLYRRYQEGRKIEALLECIEFSGIDLLDSHSKQAFTERLARDRRAAERQERWRKSRAGALVWIVTAVGGAAISLSIPDIYGWLRKIMSATP
jgi:hypothetical protein